MNLSTLLIATTVLALPAAPAAMAQETQADATASAPDAFDPLKQEFDQLYRYLSSRRGVGEAERAELLALRSRLDAFANEHPADARPVVLDLQIALWLGEDERVDAAFESLVDRAPGNTAILRRWAQARVTANRWDAALEVLEAESLASNIDAMLERARVLMNLNRFADALAALAAMPTEGVDATRLASQATALRLQLETLETAWEAEAALLAAEAEKNDLPRVRLETPRGEIVLELFEDQAPYTVANFIELVESGFYDGTRFHRVIPGFMAQGGDPNTRDGASGVAGQGGPGYTIPDESSRTDKRKHFAGRLAMAKPGDPDRAGKAKPNSAGSQFYITVVPTSHLDEEYTVFGRVLEGESTARALKGDDLVTSASVLRKRDHEYKPVKLGVTPPATPTTSESAADADSSTSDSSTSESAGG